MFAYRIRKVSFENRPKHITTEQWATLFHDLYIAEYKRTVNGKWVAYRAHSYKTWDDAYKVLEQHANPAALQVKFVGTF